MSLYDRQPKNPKSWQKDLAIMPQLDRQNRITHIAITDSTGAPLTPEDLAWIKMALATTGADAKPVASIKKQFEFPIEAALMRSFEDQEIAGIMDLEPDGRTLLAQETAADLMHVLSKIDLLRLLNEGDFYANTTNVCSHGFVICAPCGFIPAEITTEMMNRI